MANPLTDALDQAVIEGKKQAAAEKSQADILIITAAAKEFIPVGTQLSVALDALRRSGFDVIKANDKVVPEGFDERYVGGKLSSVKYGYMSTYYYEISLEIKAGKVADIFGRAGYRGL
jgi:hypothetical protein